MSYIYYTVSKVYKRGNEREQEERKERDKRVIS